MESDNICEFYKLLDEQEEKFKSMGNTPLANFTRLLNAKMREMDQQIVNQAITITQLSHSLNEHQFWMDSIKHSPPRQTVNAVSTWVEPIK